MVSTDGLSLVPFAEHYRAFSDVVRRVMAELDSEYRYCPAMSLGGQWCDAPDLCDTSSHNPLSPPTWVSFDVHQVGGGVLVSFPMPVLTSYPSRRAWTGPLGERVCEQWERAIRAAVARKRASP